MPQFGILSDMVAVRDKTPHIKLGPPYLHSDSRWAYYDSNGVHRAWGRSSELAVTPDGNPVLKYHLHTDTNQNRYLFAGTADNIYKWDSGAGQWDAMFTCSSSCTHWSMASFNGKVIATNWVDLVQVWSDATPGTAFADFGSASGIDINSGATFLTKSKYVAVFENYVHLFYNEEGGTAIPNGHRWCSGGLETDWDEAGAGDAGARQYTPGTRITGVGIYSASGTRLLIAFTDQTVETEWLVSDDTVFYWKTALDGVGCLSADSIVNDSHGNLYWLGSDYCFHRFLDETRLSVDINDTVQGLHPTLVAYVRGVYVPKLNRLWWAVPKNGQSTGNDMVLGLNLNQGGWDPPMDMAVSAFGNYEQGTTYTIDTIPFATIDGITWETIDTTDNVAGRPIMLCGDYAGYSYRPAFDSASDAGSSYTSHVVIGTDLSGLQAAAQYKRIHGFWAWFKRHADSDFDAEVYIKTDQSDSYALAATVDLSDGYGSVVKAWCPYDCRGSNFLIDIRADNNFSFYGMLFDFDWDGDR